MTACARCRLRPLCLPRGLPDADLDEVQRVIRPARALRRGEAVSWGGGSAAAVYAVRSGALKSVGTDGEEPPRIVAFHLPSELVALEALGGGAPRAAAIALEHTGLCALPLRSFLSLADRRPRLYRHLLALLGDELAAAQRLAAAAMGRTARDRLATFLLDLSRRYRRLGYSATEFRLSMPRADIADYLGMAGETLSRQVARLRAEGVVVIRGREVRIADPRALRAAASAVLDRTGRPENDAVT